MPMIEPDPAEKKITSAHIRAALALRYPTGSHVLLWEVANGTGAASRRFADAIAFGMFPSHGHEIEGIEIKVSRSDFLSEMKRPDKSQEIYQYCNRWWLAVPKGMVEVNEIPATWGLLELVGDVMRVKHKAPKLSPIPPSINFLAALVRRAAGSDEEMTALQIGREVARREAEIMARERADANNRISSRMRSAEEAMAKLALIKERTGVDLTAYVPDEQWIAAIRYLCGGNFGRSEFSEHSINYLRNSVMQLLKALDTFPVVMTADDSTVTVGKRVTA